MRKYTLFHPYIMSFFSRSLYRDVGKNWRGIGLIYLLILLLISWAVLISITAYRTGPMVDELARSVIRVLPNMTFTDGELSIDRPVPYVIRDPERPSKIVAIFDTNNTFYSIRESKAVILFQKKEAYMHDEEKGKIQTFKYPKDWDGIFGHTEMYKMVHSFKLWFPITIYPVCVIFSFIYRVIQALIYAAIGMLMAGMLDVELDYAVMLRLAIAATTPAIIISTVLGVFNVDGGGLLLWLGYFVLSMLFLLFGIHANRDSNEDDVIQLEKDKLDGNDI